MPLAACLLSTSNLKESTVVLIGMHTMGIPFSHHQLCQCCVSVRFCQNLWKVAVTQ